MYKNKRSNTWTAQITFKGKTYYLGTYEDIQDAVKARKRGEEMFENFLEWYNNVYLPGQKMDSSDRTFADWLWRMNGKIGVIQTMVIGDRVEIANGVF